MRRITAIEPQKKNPDRVNIYLDDQFAFGLARITAAWLQVGQVLPEEKVSALQLEDGREQAYQRALHFLSYRARSRAEVQRNLSGHGVAAEVVTETLDRLERGGLLGDARFAREWVENRNTFRPRSRRALSVELRRKGLDEETIAAVLAASADDEVAALSAARKYVHRLQGQDWNTFRQKLSAFLGRRGFSYAVAAQAVRQVWDEEHDRTAPKTENED